MYASVLNLPSIFKNIPSSNILPFLPSPLNERQVELHSEKVMEATSFTNRKYQWLSGGHNAKVMLSRAYYTLMFGLWTSASSAVEYPTLPETSIFYHRKLWTQMGCLTLWTQSYLCWLLSRPCGTFRTALIHLRQLRNSSPLAMGASRL